MASILNSRFWASGEVGEFARRSLCSFKSQDVFWPGTNECLEGFDFTILFEEAILAIPVTAALFLLAIPRAVYLRQSAKKVDRGFLHIAKLVGFAVLAILQLVLLALWAQPSAERTRATLATLAISFVASLFSMWFSHLEHTRSIQPSTILNLYLLLATILDIPRARTLYYVESTQAIRILFTVTVVFRALLLIPECMYKASLLKEGYKNQPTEITSGILGQSLFLWLNPLLIHGNRALLTHESFPTIDEKLSSTGVGDNGLRVTWEKLSNNRSKGSLLWAVLHYFKWPILEGAIPRFLQLGFVFAQPFLVDQTIHWIQGEDHDNTKKEGYGLIAAFAFVYIGIAVCTALAQHKVYRVISMIRASLIDMIYEKTTVMLANDIAESAPLTLMSADIERIAQGLRYIHDFWACVVEIPIALFLLWNQLSIASLAPIGVALLCMFLAGIISTLAVPRQKMWLEAIEKRVDSTANVLGAMKGVKITGLTDKIFDIIQGMRIDEVRRSEKFRRLLILVVGVAYSNVSISPFISFMAYALIARVRGEPEGLTTAQAFTALTLFTLLNTPIGTLVEAATGLATAFGSIERINRFLLGESRQDDRSDDSFSCDSRSSLIEKESQIDKLPQITLSNDISENTTLASEKDHPRTERLAFVAHNRTAGWDEKKSTVVEDLSFEIYPGTLTLVVGPVGCGKSTFVNALLGEAPMYSGSLRVRPTTIAYCGQTPWLVNSTIQRNILGESVYDMDWYNKVVRACALDQDIKIMPQGDQTILGTQGAVLSGGQKQRLTLARAIYSQVDTIILDDSFSGLDPTTEEFIFHALFDADGMLRRSNTTVIMTTNSLHRLPFADHIIALNHAGQIAEQGTFQELNAKESGYIRSLSIENQDEFQFEGSKEKAKPDAAIQQQLPLSNPETDLPIEDDDRRTGDMTVYWYYTKMIGVFRGVLFVLFVIAYVFFLAFPSIWVQRWTAESEVLPHYRLGYWLGVYGCLAALAVVFIVLSCWHLMANLVSHSAKNMHKRLLKTVLDAPMSFFFTTDTGITTNRFSQDLQLIDMELPLAMLNTVLAFTTCIAQLILICISAKYVAAVLPVCIVVFYFVQRYYLRTSRQLRFMDIEAKSPLFSSFIETLAGLATIRSYKWESAYRMRNSERINYSQKPFYLLFCIQRWLELVIGLMVAGLAVVLVGVAVATKGTLGAGFIGVALLNVVTFSENLQGLITHWTNLETSIGAVSRIRQFTNMIQSEHKADEKSLPPDNWPAKGTIEFRNVVASYKPESDPVLNDISFTIVGGKKYGICGRTGSGKSSLIATLFRLIELGSGSITIDGFDITTLPRETLRSRLICIPQEPFLLYGCSVRLNLDPSGDFVHDDILIDALKKVQIWDIVEGAGGLDANITAETFSQGQKQLVCFARAMVRKSGNVLILDEATSSIDTQTDKIMQTLIRSEFANHTVIAIAHRLDTILDFDEVVVLDQGRVKERGPPEHLLEIKGAFSDLCRDSSRSLTPLAF
ncbi:hypothetical protein AJ80_03703 [Polytolypa hystricis UAMH7299]|uniref:ABC transporter n=1 Tax=Polytolypa hystricis (strain UAMH7299) TaxID=1447883 RepID=A0A2B7YG91_POLH7|nr:hypothetical protein AJ80_03703 [Polytolypa hystricis UAMH7299]